jgi:pyrroloquinoline quinone biosynthesis protein B
MRIPKLVCRYILAALLAPGICWWIGAAEIQQSQPTEERVKVIVLGVAQDGGVPQIGCTEKICKTERRMIASLMILAKKAVYLIDATPDLRAQYKEFGDRFPEFTKPNLFDGIFLTHAHMGHYTGLMYLGKESISTRQVPVYCSADMSRYLTENGPWSLLVENGNIELHTFEANQDIPFENFTIRPVPVPHRKEFTDTHGFWIQGRHKSLLYIPDIDSWDSVKTLMAELLKKSDYALLDGTFYSGDELPGRNMRLVPHPTVLNSIEFLRSLPPFNCQIYFTHLNHTNPLLEEDSNAYRNLMTTPFRVALEWQEFLL